MSRENVTSITRARNWPRMEMGVIMQTAAEAGSETKRLIEPDPSAIHGEHSGLVISGLRAIYSGQYGEDYHGVVPSQAGNLLDYYEWPREADDH